MTTLEAFELGVMVVLTPSLVVVALLVWRANIRRERNN